MPADDFPNSVLQRVVGVFLTSVAFSTLAGCVGRVPAMPMQANERAIVKAGAKFSVPLPDQALLERQPVPHCERETTEAASEPKPPEPSSSEPAAAGEPGDGDRRRLSLQMDCYRRQEAIVRDRLLALQISVGKTIKAIKRKEAQLETE